MYLTGYCPLRQELTMSNIRLQIIQVKWLALLSMAIAFIGITQGLSFAGDPSSLATMSTQESSSPVTSAEPQEHGLSPKPVEIARPFGFPITNSMIVSWAVALVLIVFAQAATRKM